MHPAWRRLAIVHLTAIAVAMAAVMPSTLWASCSCAAHAKAGNNANAVKQPKSCCGHGAATHTPSATAGGCCQVGASGTACCRSAGDRQSCQCTTCGCSLEATVPQAPLPAKSAAEPLSVDHLVAGPWFNFQPASAAGAILSQYTVTGLPPPVRERFCIWIL